MRKKICHVCAGYHLRCIVSALMREKASLSLWLYFLHNKRSSKLRFRKIEKTSNNNNNSWKSSRFPISLPLSLHLLSPAPHSYTHTHTRLVWSSIWWRRQCRWVKKREKDYWYIFRRVIFMCHFTPFVHTTAIFTLRHLFFPPKDSSTLITLSHYTNILCCSRNSSIIVTCYQRWLKLYQRDDVGGREKRHRKT